MIYRKINTPLQYTFCSMEFFYNFTSILSSNCLNNNNWCISAPNINQDTSLAPLLCASLRFMSIHLTLLVLSYFHHNDLRSLLHWNLIICLCFRATWFELLTGRLHLWNLIVPLPTFIIQLAKQALLTYFFRIICALTAHTSFAIATDTMLLLHRYWYGVTTTLLLILLHFHLTSTTTLSIYAHFWVLLLWRYLTHAHIGAFMVWSAKSISAPPLE